MMTDKTAHEILTTLDEWAREKVKRGEGWAPGQYMALVNFLNPVKMLETPKEVPPPESRKETTSWPTKKNK